ncbi:MAG: hypothetical protein NC548_38310 [Lachnospiraceae bacterium]|nr:hypothetical protein [Lachnospiraceae bacterium]
MEPELNDIGFLTEPAVGLINLILANVRKCAAPGDPKASVELADMLTITKKLKGARDHIHHGNRVAAMDLVNEALVDCDCDYLKSRPIVDKDIPEACRTILIYQIQQELMMLRQLLVP